jgi:hypothetical protein
MGGCCWSSQRMDCIFGLRKESPGSRTRIHPKLSLVTTTTSPKERPMSHAAVSRGVGIPRYPRGEVRRDKQRSGRKSGSSDSFSNRWEHCLKRFFRQDLHRRPTMGPRDFPGINSPQMCFYLVRIIRAANRWEDEHIGLAAHELLSLRNECSLHIRPGHRFYCSDAKKCCRAPDRNIFVKPVAAGQQRRESSLKVEVRDAAANWFFLRWRTLQIRFVRPTGALHTTNHSRATHGIGMA